MIKKDIFAAALAASLVAGLSAPVDAHARHVRYDYRNDQPRQVCHGNGTTGLIVGGVSNEQYGD